MSKELEKEEERVFTENTEEWLSIGIAAMDTLFRKTSEIEPSPLQEIVSEICVGLRELFIVLLTEKVMGDLTERETVNSKTQYII